MLKGVSCGLLVRASVLKPKGCRFDQCSTAEGPLSKGLNPELLPMHLTWLPTDPHAVYLHVLHESNCLDEDVSHTRDCSCSCVLLLNVNAVTLLMGEELFLFNLTGRGSQTAAVLFNLLEL